MRIAAITKFKQGDLYKALKKLGWSQNELARRTGMQPSVLGRYMNLQLKPTEAAAQKIQNALAEAGEYIDVLTCWPDRFTGFNKVPVIEQTKDVPDEILISMMGEQNPQITYEINEEKELLNKALLLLTDRERDIVEDCFLSGISIEEKANKLNVTRSRIRQIVDRATLKLANGMRRLAKKDMSTVL